jgi:adenylylsulfate reductase, subunit B
MPPVINKKACRRCGTCAGVCPSDVFYGSEPKAFPLITYPDECWHCNACVEACPHEGAIRLRIALPLMIMHQER